MWTRQQLAYVATALLFLSLFMPLISVPMLGPVTFVRFAGGLPGLTMLLSVVLAAVFTVRRSYRLLLVPGTLAIGALGFVGWAFFEMKQTMRSEPLASRGNDDSFLRGLDAITQSMSEAVQIQWGVGVALLGAVMLIAIGVSRERVNAPEAPPTNI